MEEKKEKSGRMKDSREERGTGRRKGEENDEIRGKGGDQRRRVKSSE